MQLHLTSYDPSNSTYCSQDGKVVYKVVWTFHLRGQTVTIWRALPEIEPTIGKAEKKPSPSAYDANQDGTESSNHRSKGSSSTIDDNKKVASETEEDGFTKVAEIEYHLIRSTIIRHLGKEWKASDFFRKGGWSGYERDRIFTAHGKEYGWKMGLTLSELFLVPTDPKAEHTLVARFRTPHVGIIHETRLPSLEIFPAGEDMVDLILTTFIYNEDTMIP